MLPSPLGPDVVMTGVLLITLALAIREDLLRQRIPNALNAAALVLGGGLAFLAAGWNGLANSIGGALVGCAALIPFYLLRGMGAGDVKLMAAAGAFLGPGSALLAAALALVSGCLLAVAIVVWRLIEPRPPLETSPRGDVTVAWRAAAAISITRKERFPYAVAIGAGVVAALWLQGSLAVLTNVFGIV